MLLVAILPYFLLVVLPLIVFYVIMLLKDYITFKFTSKKKVAHVVLPKISVAVPSISDSDISLHSSHGLLEMNYSQSGHNVININNELL